MDNCVLFCGQSLGGIPPELLQVAEGAFVVGVDSGMAHLEKMKLVPTLWVGDGDSYDVERLKKMKTKVPKVKLPKTKDYSDLELALHLACEAYLERSWSGDLILFGAQGGRFDHDFGNIMVVARWLQELAQTVGAEHCPNVISYGVHGTWAATASEMEFDQQKGATFSVFPLGDEGKITITGAKYAVKNKGFEHATTGMSNEGLGKAVTVKVSKAVATVFFPVMGQ